MRVDNSARVVTGRGGLPDGNSSTTASAMTIDTVAAVNAVARDHRTGNRSASTQAPAANSTGSSPAT